MLIRKDVSKIPETIACRNIPPNNRMQLDFGSLALASAADAERLRRRRRRERARAEP